MFKSSRKVIRRRKTFPKLFNPSSTHILLQNLSNFLTKHLHQSHKSPKTCSDEETASHLSLLLHNEIYTNDDLTCCYMAMRFIVVYESRSAFFPNMERNRRKWGIVPRYYKFITPLSDNGQRLVLLCPVIALLSKLKLK